MNTVNDKEKNEVDQEESLSRCQNLFSCDRHDKKTLEAQTKTRKVVQWRMKERMKTVSVALTLCLNIGVDPPDVIKTNPCARKECWIDPLQQPPQKALESIGKKLQEQYEHWQPRAKCKQSLDPTVDDVKKLCTSMRRSAKEERVLFHYNGHGVPKPTTNGEIWVFNKNYTQYIPLSLFELQSWMGTPSIYVFDCSAAGLAMHYFHNFADQREQELEQNKRKAAIPGSPAPTNSSPKIARDYILLGACGVNEVLPTNPDLPADLFTSCLTTPIKIGLKWFCSQTIISGISPDLIDKITGKANDRRTPFGELNWIFTAITDTIAWNVLHPELFQKLFRQDLLVASLFRNYLLAERIMRSCKCTPLSFPKLPPTYNHPMWQAWDLAADHCLAQLPQMMANDNYEYRHSTFFTEQLTAFEVWLEFGTEDKNPPEQLPIVLQVLLSQQHRLRALELLGRFLDLGPWAVNQALSVGIFPYVLKLLQSPAPELRKILVFIWAKILALDQSCQLDLVKDNGQHYFVNVLLNPKIPSEQRRQSAFILSVICNNCRPGQSACLNAKLLQICLVNINNPDPILRRWVVFCLAKLWENHEEGKRAAIKENAHVQLCGLLTDPVPEVRAAAVYALGTLIGKAEKTNGGNNREQRRIIELNLGLTFAVVTTDASPLVRKELIIALYALVNTYRDKFKQIEKNFIRQRLERLEAEAATRKKRGMFTKDTESEKSLTEKSQQSGESTEMEDNGIFEFLWKLVVSLKLDPYPLLANIANAVVNKIYDEVKEEMSENKDSRSGSPTTLRNQSRLNLLIPAEKDPEPGRSKSPGKIGSVKTSKPGMLSGVSEKLFRKKQTSPPRGLSPDHSVAPVEERIISEEIRSCIYEWSCQYFSKPLLEPEEEDETSPAFSERKWRMQRNRELILESMKLRDSGKTRVQALENEIAILENENKGVQALQFHPFENIVVVADEHDGILVWNWEDGATVNHFRNTNPQGTRITALDLLNEQDIAMISAGSDDGVVRIWGDIYGQSKPKLVTSWRAIGMDSEKYQKSSVGASLVLEWQQNNGIVISAGNVDIIKIWDVNRELSIQDISTNCESCVTCLTSDKLEGGRLIVAGCADGSIRLFDRRTNTKYNHVSTFTEHKDAIIKAFIPNIKPQQIISGCRHGLVKFWDPRNVRMAETTLIGHKDPTVMSAFAVHHYAPLISIGSEDQRIKIMNFNGEEISLIRYHDGFLGQRIGPVSYLTFHPYKVMLAAGATDSIVSIYSGSPN